MAQYEGRDNPIIGIIVSDRLSHCDGFLRRNHLPREVFRFVTNGQEDRLQGMDYNVPVIVTWCDADLSYELTNMLKLFKSVRYMDY